MSNPHHLKHASSDSIPTDKPLPSGLENYGYFETDDEYETEDDYQRKDVDDRAAYTLTEQLDDIEDYDEDAVTGKGCCGEARVNFFKVGEELKDEGREISHTMSKIDVKKAGRSCFSYEKLKRVVPILEWGPKYRLAELQGDLIAGFTVGLTVLPQSIAYANIANVPPQYGLYSAFIGSFVYAIFGGSKDITLGPSAIMSILTASYGKSPVDKDPTYAIALGFFTGIVQLIMYFIGFGAFCDFISFPVMKAFTTAAAITIGMTQVKKWWGLRKVSRDFIPQLIQTIQKIPETRLWDFVMGVVCIFFIVLFRKIKEMKIWSRPTTTLSMRILNKTVWLVGTARNILVIVAASIAAYIFLENGSNPFSLIGYIPPGIPTFQTPNFTLFDPKSNKTYDANDITSTMGIGFIVLPMIGLIEAMAIGRVFARKFSYRMDPNQEFLSYGIGNLLGAFVMGYPITGTFSRTALNAASGVKTQAGGIVTGILVLLALQFLTPLFYYIPEAALAVVIIMAVLDMMTFHKFWIIWRTRRIDLLPWIVTFILSFVLNVEYGIAIGVIVSFLILIYPIARPKVKVFHIDDALWKKLFGKSKKMNIVITHLNVGLMYPAVSYIKDKIKNKSSSEQIEGMVLDMAHAAIIDTTAIQGMRELLEDLQKRDIMVVACNLQKQPSTMFKRAKPKYFHKASTIEEAVYKIATAKSGNTLKLKNTTQLQSNSSVVNMSTTNSRAPFFLEGDDDGRITNNVEDKYIEKF